jgi:hypothetical protein
MINNISECQGTPPKSKQNHISNSSVVRMLTMIPQAKKLKLLIVYYDTSL